MPEPVTWTVHLAARRPLRALVVIVIIITAIAGVVVMRSEPAVTILAAVLLFASAAEFLLPVTYTLDEKGAHLRYFGNHRVIPWKRVRRLMISLHAIKLTPLSVKSPLESYRGVLLRMPDSGETLVLIREWLQQAGAEYTEEEFVE
ncbi:MAG: hypothetical protein WCJ56_00160 [bacterium]